MLLHVLQQMQSKLPTRIAECRCLGQRASMCTRCWRACGSRVMWSSLALRLALPRTNGYGACLAAVMAVGSYTECESAPSLGGAPKACIGECAAVAGRSCWPAAASARDHVSNLALCVSGGSSGMQCSIPRPVGCFSGSVAAPRYFHASCLRPCRALQERGAAAQGRRLPQPHLARRSRQARDAAGRDPPPGELSLVQHGQRAGKDIFRTCWPEEVQECH